MKKEDHIINIITEQGLLPLFYFDDGEVSINIIRSLYKAGIRALEYTNRGKMALKNFALLKELQKQEMTDLYLGIGTVKTLQEAEDFLSLEADFIVCPIVSPEIIALTQSRDTLCIPGCMTPTEIQLACNNGIKLIKLFPANTLQPDFLSAIKSIFPDQLFMPTGGVDLNIENLSAWFSAGACAVGLGSILINNDLMKNQLYDQLTEKVINAIQLIRSARYNE